MKFKYTICCFMLVLFCATSFAQGENNIWTFGNTSGLDFNGGSLNFFADSIKAVEGSAAVCDKSGNLLFYSDGLFAYDRAHNVMPNGSGLLGNLSATQGVAIAPVPGDDSLYYLFTQDAYETRGGHKLLYNLVDMRLNGGLGDIRSTSKNVLIDSLFSEKMAIGGSCGRNWLVVHKIDSPLFYAYDLSKVSPFISPVISRSGIVFGALHYMVGEMKFSKDFKKIAVANFNFGYSKGSIELHDFNQKTGRFSNFELLDSFVPFLSMGGGPYGLEFSQNGKMLYSYNEIYDTSGSYPTGIYQYDISLMSTTAKRLSKILILRHYGKVGIRRAPDNTLFYTCFKWKATDTFGFVGRILYPNLKGLACTAKTDTLFGWKLNSSIFRYGFGNRYIPLYEANKDTSFSTIPKQICAGWPLLISGLGYDEYFWYDGDTSSRKTFSSPGTYWLRSMNNCLMSIDTFVISLQASDSSFHLWKDSSVCLGSTFIASAPDTVAWYRWSDGDTAKSKTIHSPDTLILYTNTGNCHIRFDSIKVKPIIPTYTYFRKDTNICPLSSVTLLGKAGSDKYTWFDGSNAMAKTFVATTGSYWVQSQKDCAITVDTFRLIEKPSETISSLKTANICADKEVILSAVFGMDHYVWNTGDTNHSINTNLEGTYWAKSGKDCKLYVDSFIVTKKPYNLSTISVDSSICFRSEAIISIPSLYDSYLWSGGNATRDTTVYTNGTIAFLATNNTNCEQLNKQYNLSFIDFSVQSRDTFTCNKDNILLKPEVSILDAQYRWSTGDTTASITVNKAGSKFVHISYKGCTLTDTINVAQKILDLNIGSDSIICEGKVLQLEANLSDAQYLWTTGATEARISVSQSGTYGLSISKDACKAYQQVTISVVPCDNCVSIPNTFSPNNDGINDFFKPILHCPANSYQLKIYNRWGEVIFYSDNANTKWDGSTNGEYAAQNVYYYLLKISFAAQGSEVKMYKGDITLIR